MKSSFAIAAACASLVAVSIAGGCAMKPENKIVEISTRASYGYAQQRKDVRDDLTRLCIGKSSCTFMVKNETFTAKEPLDPAPGESKSVVFGWKCPDGDRKGSGVEGHMAELTCK